MGVGYWSVTVGSVGTLVVVAVIWCGGYGALNWCLVGLEEHKGINNLCFDKA
jgi:hypothetical protein